MGGIERTHMTGQGGQTSSFSLLDLLMVQAMEAGTSGMRHKWPSGFPFFFFCCSVSSNQSLAKG